MNWDIFVLDAELWLLRAAIGIVCAVIVVAPMVLIVDWVAPGQTWLVGCAFGGYVASDVSGALNRRRGE